LGFAFDRPDNMLVELSYSGDANRPIDPFHFEALCPHREALAGSEVLRD
jgi:hypothetical protein